MPFIFDDVDRPVGHLVSLLKEARGLRPESVVRAWLGLVRLNDSPEADRCWRAFSLGVTGLRLDVVDVGDVRGEQGDLVRGRGLRAVAIVALDDAEDRATRVLSCWEERDGARR